jgi:hypothetical protein
MTVKLMQLNSCLYRSTGPHAKLQSAVFYLKPQLLFVFTSILIKVFTGYTSAIYTPVFPALGKLRQENCEFQGNLGYTVGPFLKKKKSISKMKKGRKGGELGGKKGGKKSMKTQ